MEEQRESRKNMRGSYCKEAAKKRLPMEPGPQRSLICNEEDEEATKYGKACGDWLTMGFPRIIGRSRLWWSLVKSA
jgi:hypothetical protein